jgi:hypothetical protein
MYVMPQYLISQIDSLNIDSTLIVPMQLHGAPCMSTIPLKTITKYDIQLINALNTADIISLTSPFMTKHLGDKGLFSSISIFGSQIHNLQASMNGVPINDCSFGTVNLENISIESLQSLTIMSGTDAAILGGSSGVFIYGQLNQYSSEKPYTRMQYQQAAYDYIASEGLFSQNISQNANVFLGFRRQSSSNPTQSTSISITELFTNHGVNDNGGLSSNSSYNDPLTAQVLIVDMNRRQFRHDIIGTITYLPQKDSSLLYTSSIYVTTTNWEINNGSLYNDTSIFQHINNVHSGIESRAEYVLNPQLRSTVGLGLSYQHNAFTSSISDYSGINAHSYFHFLYTPTDKLAIASGCRVQKMRDSYVFFSGIKTFYSFSQITAGIDLSISSRMPSIIDNYSNTALEKHTLIYTPFSYQTNNATIKVSPFIRMIQNPFIAITTYDSNKVSLLGNRIDQQSSLIHTGLMANMSLNLGKNITVQAQLHYQNSTLDDSTIYENPSLYIVCNAEYKQSIGNSEILGGCTISGMSTSSGSRYIPQTMNISYESSMVQTMGWNGVEIYASAKLGNARVRASVLNLFNATMMEYAGYPIQDNTFRFSVAWSFND